ncbi:hypothetical protein IV38_GL001469 [Lactobacillus selangorensis]|uniref:YigZ family protein n=1 Tax=Lactobacillus selangorensis TaxID=81857 RepID=A0A0R2FUC5_9LACO|nr:YigZ family protein [Lactobacillus selangorensis]KRN28468.1 hypothetical protein IV38_GL001469 [Lactobacillus selangorensis]KRN31969.1 hypothetical protein IV40_GL001256 [Lactobacillus selangorensis]
MITEYITIAHDGQNEQTIKKSRFICTMKRVATEKEAQAFIEQIRKAESKANHHCFAYQIGDHNQVQRASDDGEPSGTAGVPMLNVLKQMGLQNVVAVTTRYFGGIKLGSGGLIRAYSHSVSQAAETIGIVRGHLQKTLKIKIAYPQLGTLNHYFDESPYSIEQTDYTDQVTVTAFIDFDQIDAVQHELIDLLNDQVTFTVGKAIFQETPIDPQTLHNKKDEN